jgi:glycosyltransferase involved in cell wall biosynthesis
MRHFEIVVVSPEAPDPFGNPAGRWYYVLAKGLSERGHRVRWLAAYTQEIYAARARASLRHRNLSLTLYPYEKRGWLRRKWSTLRRPYSYFISDSLVRDLQAELTRGYDVLHLEHTWCGWLGLKVPRALLSIQWLARVDMAGSDFGSCRRLLSSALMKWTERRIIRSFTALRALTPRDARVIEKLNPRAKVFTIPLAIDPDLYPFSATDCGQLTIGLIGSMSWQPTRSAAVRLMTRIWPNVKARLPGAQLLIVGRGARRSLRSFLECPGVTILEDVPEAEPYFRQLCVLAYPVAHGSGMKVKVLEAMAYGTPVVTTSEGIEGIDAVNGRHVAIADRDEAFADEIVALAGNREVRTEMRLAARRLLQERYTSGPVLLEIERAYETIC